MSKKEEQPIKIIHVTCFDDETFTFTTKKVKVVRECSRYVSLEDGSRINVDIISDLFADGYYKCYRNTDNIEYRLIRGENVYTLKPISKTVKDTVKKAVIETLKTGIESDKRWLADRENSVIELKAKIAEKEARLEHLLKL